MVLKDLLSLLLLFINMLLKIVYAEAYEDIIASQDIFITLQSISNPSKSNVIGVEQGASVKLFCSLRGVEANKEPKEWYFIKREPHYLKAILSRRQLYIRNMSISSDHVLIIKHFNTSFHSGIYSCENRRAYRQITTIVTYVLEGVFSTSQRPYTGRFKDWVKYKEGIINPINKQFENPNQEPFATFKKLCRFSFRVYTHWEPWSKCKVLNGQIGQRTRNGRCRLKVVPNINNNAKNISALKLNPDLNNDVLCRSKSLDKKIPAISRLVRFIPDYVAKDPCVLLYGQRILRGITKNFTTSWIDEHTISTTVQIPEGGHRILACPETVLKSKVDWLKDDELLNSSFWYNIAKTEEEPAVTIDSFNSIIILHATKIEEGNYSCIVDKRKVRNYDVRVYTKSGLLNDDFFRYSVYLGFVLLLTTTCYCAGICVAWHERESFFDPFNIKTKRKPYDYVQIGWNS